MENIFLSKFWTIIKEANEQLASSMFYFYIDTVLCFILRFSEELNENVGEYKVS